MHLSKEKLRIFWRRFWGHKECRYDVYLLDGTVYLDLRKKDWDEYDFGILREYREVNDTRKIAKYYTKKYGDYPPEKILDRIVFQCSTCTLTGTCEKLHRGNNRRYEE